MEFLSHTVLCIGMILAKTVLEDEILKQIKTLKNPHLCKNVGEIQ
jgi:hypothetical protein